MVGQGYVTGKPKAQGRTAIRRRSDFERLYSSGKRYRTSLLTAVVLFRGDEEVTCRAAFVVGRKVARQAVRRNRVRRRLREAYRSYRGLLAGGADLALVAQPAAAQASYWELRSALGELLRRAGLLSAAAAGRGEAG